MTIYTEVRNGRCVLYTLGLICLDTLCEQRLPTPAVILDSAVASFVEIWEIFDVVSFVHTSIRAYVRRWVWGVA